ncbi:epoxide hydrolase [Conexibacter stalactiti]|uniref:Epoxide hydrolase n=1 Tax=Conexibacter stalactiti TaxID=1940611 RepID=A0ABU4HI97_9ACTN|nr:epoxide hydrolase [Conexibacter stalactiti]MDW5593033.1 epoxide hydrolase [Conexibacter stalactiti]MEC5033674.1 epoxide hydrolase [Conexibacter stalactiti]
MTDRIEPFHLSVPESDLADLRDRVARVRWPDRETVRDTSQGPQLAKLRALTERWRGEYDWRTCEAELNALGQYRTTIDGLGIHFLHVRSPERDALPLLLTHGWPGSILEFRKVIGPLTDPAAHGGDPRTAFHVVVPSMPGFGFSERPREPGWNIARVADAWIELMRRLGYDRWGAQGGDLGCAVTDTIASRTPPGLVGLHLNFAMFPPLPDEIENATTDEQAMLDSAQFFWDQLSGYARVQSTRPQTIGYALADSPVGLAAWIYAMFQDTCGTPGDAEGSLSQDEMLDDITLYWLTNTAASSARLYWEMVRSGRPSPASPATPITLPTGFTMFPEEHVRKSRRWLERRYSNVIFFNQPERGGHFGALEQPLQFVDDVRATFATIRADDHPGRP